MAKKKTKKKAVQTVVKDSTFIGVQYDAKSIDAIDTIAEALLVNGHALSKLAGVFNAQGVKIECLLKIDG